jgi:hypothetical protein
MDTLSWQVSFALTTCRAAAVGYMAVMTPQPRSDRPDDAESEGQVSLAGSSLTPQEPLGGADAVPDTPDNVPADHPDDAESGTSTTR